MTYDITHRSLTGTQGLMSQTVIVIDAARSVTHHSYAIPYT